MTLTWPNVHTAQASYCTTRGLWNSIGLCAVHQQLHWAEFLFAFAGGNGMINLGPTGLVFSDELLEVQALLNRARSERATGLRSPDLGAGDLASDLPGTHEAIFRALNGTPMSDIKRFQGTPLAEIAPGHGKELLAHLWITTEVAHVVSTTSTLLHGHNEGVVLIPHPMPISFPKEFGHIFASVIDLLFWTKRWFRFIRRR